MTSERLFACVRLFAETGLSLALSAAIVWMLRLPAARRVPGLRRPAKLLPTARALLLASLVLPALLSLAPRERLLEPQARLVSALPRAVDAGRASGHALWLAPAMSAPGWVPASRVALDPRFLGLALATALAGAATLAALRAFRARKLACW